MSDQPAHSSDVEITFHLCATGKAPDATGLKDGMELETWMIQKLWAWLSVRLSSDVTFDRESHVYLRWDAVMSDDDGHQLSNVASYRVHCPIHYPFDCEPRHPTIRLLLREGEESGDSEYYVDAVGNNPVRYDMPPLVRRQMQGLYLAQMKPEAPPQIPSPSLESDVSSGRTSNTSNFPRPPAVAPSAATSVATTPENPNRIADAKIDLPERLTKRRESPVPAQASTSPSPSGSFEETLETIPHQPPTTVSNAGTASKAPYRKSSSASLASDCTMVTEKHFMGDPDSVGESVDPSNNTAQGKGGEHP